MSLRQPPRRPIASHCRDSWCTQRTDVRLASSAAPCSLPFFPNQSYPIAYSFSFHTCCLMAITHLQYADLFQPSTVATACVSSKLVNHFQTHIHVQNRLAVSLPHSMPVRCIRAACGAGRHQISQKQSPIRSETGAHKMAQTVL